MRLPLAPLAVAALAAVVVAATTTPGSKAAFTAHKTNAGNTISTAADWIAPAVTLTAPADGLVTKSRTPALSGTAGTAAGDSATVTARIYAGATAGGTAVQTLTATGASWTATPTALADGTYTAQASQTDGGGNTGRSATRTFTVDTTAPKPVSVSATDGGTTPGRLGAGDTITFTYDDVIDPASVFPGWDGSSVAMQVHFANVSGGDTFTLQTSAGATTINLESGVNTSADLVSGAVNVTARMSRSANGRSFAVVLDAPTGGRIVTTPNTAKNMAWTAKAGPVDRAGNALVVPGSPVTETDNDVDF